MGPEFIIPLVAIVSLFIVFPGMVFHYITLWRKQKTLEPDDERMLEDLWRSAKAMERRIETLEKLVDTHPEDAAPVSRQPRSSFDQ
jgi:phage shock protein B